MKKVSVIIPLHNAEQYIWQCIQSVISQSWRDLEILVIDDGSTDRSLKICKEFCQLDDRIRILSQEHKGVSVARNYGIEAAAGEYVFFLDSDDVLHPLLLEIFVRQAEASQTEVVFCAYNRLESRQMDRIRCDLTEKEKSVQWEIAEKSKIEEWFHLRFERELSGIGGKMIRRDCIGRQRFYEHLASGEDTLFLYALCRRQVKMAYADVGWYYYRIHPDSASHRWDMYRICQKLKVYEKIRDQEYRDRHWEWALRWERDLVWNILSVYLVMKNRKEKRNSRYLKQRMSVEMKHPVYKKLSGGMRILFFILFVGCSYLPPVRTMWVVKQKIWKTYV